MAKKRVNGEGTIGKRKDGRWEARYIVGRDPETGKQIRKSILGKTQAEVRAKLKDALAEAAEIDVVKSSGYSVSGWMQAWYSLYAQPNVRETTARYYKGYIDHHVLPRLGDIPLNKLTSLDIQQFYKDLLENGRIREDTKAKKPGLSSTTVHGIHVMLKSALKRAVQERLIPFNPAEFCIPPKITKPELQVIPSERYQSYLTAAEQRGVLPMFYLELATGLRKGEIAALLWSDYDAQTQTIHVTKQYLFYNGQGTVSPPKSSTSVRYVSIPEEAAKLLEQEHEKHPKNPYMFPSPVTGEMYHPDAIVKIHRKICKDIGLERVRFHDLRHSFATTALQCGVDVKTVSTHARSQQRRLYAERLHALDQPDAAGSSADRRQRHAQDAGALKNAKNNARLQSKKQSGVGISNKKILRYRQKINVFKARTRCGKLKRKYTIR